MRFRLAHLAKVSGGFGIAPVCLIDAQWGYA